MRNNRKIIAIVCVVTAVIIVIGAGAVLYLNRGGSGQGTVTPSPTAPSSTPISGQDTNFKGIYVFSGKNSSALANNPSVSGTYLGYYWSQLEPQQGQYNWSVIDNDMQPWVSQGKNVILRISTAGWKAWGPPYSVKGTPQWVYDMGVPSVKETDGAIIPQYWNTTFQQNLNTFVQAFASRYDGNAHVSAVEIGVGDGGETKPDTRTSNKNLLQQWEAIGYTNEIWWNTVQQIITMYSSSFHKTPLVVMPDNTFIAKESGYSETLVVNYAVSHNLWLQDNGLKANRSLPDLWKKVPIVAEQLETTAQTGDTLQQDIQAGLDNKAAIILVFASDISNSANQPTLKQAAALVRH